MVAVLALYGMLLQSFFAGVVGASAPAPLHFETAALCVSGQAQGLSAPGPEAPTHSGGHACVCLAMCHGALAGGPDGATFALGVSSVALRLAAFSDPAPAPGLRLPPARGPPHHDHAKFA